MLYWVCNCTRQMCRMISQSRLLTTSVMWKTLRRGVMSRTGSYGIVSASSSRSWTAGRIFIKIYLCVMTACHCHRCRHSRRKTHRYFTVINCQTLTRQQWTGLEQRSVEVSCWVVNPVVFGCTTCLGIQSSFVHRPFHLCLVRSVQRSYSGFRLVTVSVRLMESWSRSWLSTNFLAVTTRSRWVLRRAGVMTTHVCSLLLARVG